ncbi:kinase-like domain-containing protein [Glomus cerebriforme]|uniref:Kinase-like domain-containing protein n=1 Tax=Glomus cerebriforme TaxID=658196 RepID=A0A397SL87_9GLOM|nr:kinase-like domain-containing protein [Glomus cerebriforme]
MKNLCSLLKIIYNSIKKTKKLCSQKVNKIKNNKNRNQTSKKLVTPETYPIRSFQGNGKKITNRYEEMIKNEKELINNTTRTKVISMELRLKNGVCLSCIRELEVRDWCRFCEAKKFEQNFKNWTSGNSEVDELIRKSQLNAQDGLDYFEWIDYREIESIEYITKGGSSRIFKGVWIKGPKHKLDSKKLNWRNIPNTTVALKEMNSFDQFLYEVQNHQKFLCNHENHVLRCFGITKSPEDDVEFTKWLEKNANRDSCFKERPKPNSYMMVLLWADDGNLFNYIKNKECDEKFTWYKRLEILKAISDALESIHGKKMIHQDLHCGNILMDDKDQFQFPAISDLGLCGSYNQTDAIKGRIEFIAPEHLKPNPEPFTTASDIYSFGIIMWVICCCNLPYREEYDNTFLPQCIIDGFRPEIPKNIPSIYTDLMKRCWDNDLNKRPNALELKNNFSKWKKQYYSDGNEFFMVEKERLNKIRNPDLFDNISKNQEIEYNKNIIDLDLSNIKLFFTENVNFKNF